jgi:tetratricopeptide (TPR) repeat protein
MYRLRFLVLLYVLLSSFAQVQTSAQGSQTILLKLGEPLERKLVIQQKQTFQLQLNAGECARLVINADDDFDVTVQDASGQVRLDWDVTPPATPSLLLYAETATLYQICLSASQSLPTSISYRLSLSEKHTATARDKSEAAAWRAHYEALRLYNQPSSAVALTTAEMCHEAVRQWEVFGDLKQAGVMLNLLGLSLHRRDDLHLAEQAYQQALQYFRQISEREREINTISNLARLYARSGAYQQALECAGQVLAFARQTGDQVKLRASLITLAQLYRYSGELQKAVDLNHEVVQLARTAHSLVNQAQMQEAQGLYGLGLSYVALGEDVRGLVYLTEALAVQRRRGQDTSAFTTAIELHQGLVYLRRGAPQKALEILQPLVTRLSAERNALQGLVTLPNLVSSLNHLGAAHFALGQYPEAQAAFQRSLTLNTSQNSLNTKMDAQLGLARIARAQQRWQEARAAGEQALVWCEKQQARIADPELRTALFATQRVAYEFQTDLLMQMSAQILTQRAELQAAALHVSERARARTLLDLLSNPGVTTAITDNERDLRQKIETTDAALHRIPATDTAQRAALNRELTLLTTTLKQQQQSAQHGAFVRAQTLPLTLPELQRQVLDENTVLLEYALGAERSYLFVVTPHQLHSYVLPPRARLEPQARALYELLESFARPPAFANFAAWQKWLRARQRQYDQAAAQLSQILLGPASHLLSGKRVLIVPDGALHYVPFGALPSPPSPLRVSGFGFREQNPKRETQNSKLKTQNAKLKTHNSQPLIADHEILTLPSASTLAVLRREALNRAPATKTLAVFADPVYARSDERLAPASLLVRHDSFSGNSALRFERLPATGREATFISQLVPAQERVVAYGFDANYAAATSPDLNQYRYIHFATHGWLNSRHPEFSGLVLSQVDAQGVAQNGYLRTLDVFNLKLNAELVVLSGCRTALGKEVNGEGLIGLTRGFMYAGAQRVVASLWQVSDDATAMLMQQFYQGMLGKQKLAPAAALRAAQLALQKDPRYNAPYYWAAFTLQGEW